MMPIGAKLYEAADEKADESTDENTDKKDEEPIEGEVVEEDNKDNKK